MICLQPITVLAKKINGILTENRTYAVPCGVCAVCKQNRVQEWVFRLKQQQKVSFQTDFVTLTYTDENLPLIWSDYHNNTVGTLNPDDLKNFWKRLRKNYKNAKETKIKYYACGEYGEHTWRPHYHAIIFNLPSNEIEKRDLLWKSWGLGAVYISPEETGADAMAYTAKYIDKIDKMHSDDVRVKKFSRMSHGIGKSYLTKETVQYHRNKPLERNYVSTGYTSGSKQRMPRYYRQKIYSKIDRHLQAQQIQKEKIEREAELSNPFKTEFERKLHAERKFISKINKKSRHGESKENSGIGL